MINNLKTVLNVFLGAVLIFFAAYLFGWDFFSGYLLGNDIGMVQTAASWFDRFFPNIPQWFPLHGSGVSMFAGTQIGAPILTVLTSRLLPINLVQSIHLWEFLAVYLTALGVFIFVAVKFKSWTAAVLAGIFYLLSDASWVWLSGIGLYANAITFIFYPPAILFLDLFLTEIFGQRRQKRVIFWLAVTSLSAAMALLTHFTAGTVLFEAMLVYAFFFSLFTEGKKVKNLLLGILGGGGVILVAALLASFWLFPFLRYTNVASRNVLPVWSFEQIPFITLSALFGFSGVESLSLNNSMWYLFFSRPVWILAVIGIIFAFWQKNKIALAISFIFIFFVFYAVAPGVVPWLVKKLFIFWRDIYIRSLIPAIIFLPVLAAWSCLVFGQILARLVPKINLTAVFTFLLAFLVLFLLKGAPPNPSKDQRPCYQGFGRWHNGSTSIDYCHFWEKLANIDLHLSSLGAPQNQTVAKILERLDLSTQDRVDISPRHGNLIGSWSNVSNTPIAPLYWYIMALNWKFLGFQEGVFYDRLNIEPIEAIPELASWFGIKYVLLHRSEDIKMIEKNKTDPVGRYTDENWEEIFYEQGENLEVKKFKKPTGLVTWTSRPTILVVGNIKRQAYEQIFRKATGGAIPYEKALIVEGREDGRIDKYTLEELKKFDAIILYGQVYEDKEKVDKLLSDYVKTGGRVFIESGWQFTNSEWQAHQTLEVVPLKKLEWDSGPALTVKLDTSSIGGQFDQEKFGKFIYYEYTWDVTTAPLSEVKAWGTVVYQRNEKPLIIVGNFGSGRVVWSGMNLFGHLDRYQSREEYNFSQKLFDWLLEGKERKDLALSYSRPNPDKIEFTLNESNPSYSFLLWRENFYPDWKASIQPTANSQQPTVNLPIYRAGPNLMLMRIPPVNGGEKIKLEFKLSIIPLISSIVSLLTFILLLVFLIFPQTVSFFAGLAKKGLAVFSKTVLEDEEQ